MRVTYKMPMYEYDAWVQEYRPEKMPDWRGGDPRRIVGDAVYDFSEDSPRVRPGSMHTIDNRENDLSGEYALLSEHFFYFGSRSIDLPEHLQGLVQRRQGHHSRANAPYLEPFLYWLTGLGLQSSNLHGNPAGATPSSICTGFGTHPAIPASLNSRRYEFVEWRLGAFSTELP